MFQQQKKKILTQYARSPRCVQSLRSRPNDQFYSWKNYLNPDIDALYKKLTQHQNETQIKQESYESEEELSNNNRQSRETTKSYEICKVQQKIENKSNLCTVEIGTNTPHKMYKHHHRHSNSVATGESSPKTNDFKMQVSSQYSFSVPSKSIESSSPQQQNTIESHFICQKQPQMIENSFTKQLHSKRMKLIQPRNSQNLTQQKQGLFSLQTKQKNIKNQLDLYHLELKQQQRLYLLSKFIDHYEQIHQKKF